ncbi:hypothetical protein B0A50_01457 [Salinomyces thailandicus]|uniref:ABM domain-containing protein n=1 Tax=Salinomyces thailandicus TaxID=706561 RepID=A0A4U0UAF1_9PEZI|nr:hypothetical protein B0A50_01457 [Salinomyces thailandica]
MDKNGIALFCTLHPASTEKQAICLDLLRQSSRDYYRHPSSLCTSWSYFTPFPPPKPNSKTAARPTICGLEVYTQKSALQAQVDDPVHFQAYHEKVRREGLYEKPEELVAWWLSEGFVARDGDARATRGSGGTLVSVTRMVAKDRGEVSGFMKPFAAWVAAKEPGVLTYAILTRPKAPKELLLVVRYEDKKALRAHSEAPEHVEIVEKLSRALENSVAGSTTLWVEIEDSFVAENLATGSTSSKL